MEGTKTATASRAVVLIENIPLELRSIPNWICWKFEARQGKKTKVLFNPSTGKHAQSNNAKTWVTFTHAVAALETGKYDGIGFVFTQESGIIGIDLDHCISEDGVLHDWAERIVAQLDTYTEITPSGSGLHLITKGVLPQGGRKKGDVEIYAAGRFFTVTGNQWPGSLSTVEARQEQIESLHAEYFTKEEPAVVKPHANGHANGHHSEAAASDDDARIALMLNSKNGAVIREMWDGGLGGHKSQSEADSALCFHLAFWLEKNPARVDAAFRKSGLMREKWDKPHHASGETYGERTVRVACERVNETYKPAPEMPKGVLRGRKARAYIRGEESDDSEVVETEINQEDDSEPEQREDVEEKNPYVVRNGRICVFREVKTRDGKDISDAVVCDFVAHIVEEITTEDGGRHFKIEGRTAPSARSPKGRRFEFEISALEFSDEKRLKAALTTAAGAQSPVRKGMAGHVGPAIQKLTGDLSEFRRFERTGWSDKGFLIPGRSYDGADVQVAELPYQLTEDADLEKGLECLDALICMQERKMTTVAATIAFQAPLGYPAGWRNERYAIFVSGQTGSFKSEFAKILMSMYGPNFMDESNLVKWGEGGTRNAIGRISTISHDLPLLIDNFKPNTGRGSDDFVAIMHAILEGAEKRRMTQFQKLVGKRPIWCWPLVTGEDVPDVDSAALARILIVTFPKPDENKDTPILTKAQNLSLHLCAVGKAWIVWLESEAGQKAAKRAAELFPEARNVWREHLRLNRSRIANPFRVASNLATNELTWWAMSQCPALADFVAKYREIHLAGLQEVSGTMAMQTSEALEAHRFLSVLRSLISTERAVVLGYGRAPNPDERERVVGWYKDDEKCILLDRDIAIQAVKRIIGPDGLNNISPVGLTKQLYAMGVIADHDRGRLTKSARASASGKKEDYLCLKDSLINESEGNPDDSE